MEQILSLMPQTYMWWVMIGCAFIIGMTKTSIQAIGTIVVPIMALTFGAKTSTGLLLPMLCIADLGAIIYYRKNCSFSHLVKLLGWAILGLIVGIGVDAMIPSTWFKYLLAFSILISATVLIYNQMKGHKSQTAHKKWVLAIYGIVGGFATMIGNAAGPILSVYLLSVNMPKLAFVGTSAWFFMAINYIKIPLQIWAWDNININYILANLLMIPFIFLGSVAGIILVKRLGENSYRNLIIWVTILSAFTLLIF